MVDLLLIILVCHPKAQKEIDKDKMDLEHLNQEEEDQ